MIKSIYNVLSAFFNELTRGNNSNEDTPDSGYAPSCSSPPHLYAGLVPLKYYAIPWRIAATTYANAVKYKEYPLPQGTEYERDIKPVALAICNDLIERVSTDGIPCYNPIGLPTPPLHAESAYTYYSFRLRDILMSAANIYNTYPDRRYANFVLERVQAAIEDIVNNNGTSKLNPEFTTSSGSANYTIDPHIMSENPDKNRKIFKVIISPPPSAQKEAGPAL